MLTKDGKERSGRQANMQQSDIISKSRGEEWRRRTACTAAACHVESGPPEASRRASAGPVLCAKAQSIIYNCLYLISTLQANLTNEHSKKK